MSFETSRVIVTLLDVDCTRGVLLDARGTVSLLTSSCACRSTEHDTEQTAQYRLIHFTFVPNTNNETIYYYKSNTF